jgi:hypothetical protein
VGPLGTAEGNPSAEAVNEADAGARYRIKNDADL